MHEQTELFQECILVQSEVTMIALWLQFITVLPVFGLQGTKEHSWVICPWISDLLTWVLKCWHHKTFFYDFLNFINIFRKNFQKYIVKSWMKKYLHTFSVILLSVLTETQIRKCMAIFVHSTGHISAVFWSISIKFSPYFIFSQVLSCSGNEVWKF